MSMSKQLLQCELCSYQTKVHAKHDYKGNFFLRRHAHISDAEKLICDQCGHAVFGRTELWQHIFRSHLGQLKAEMLMCEECGRRCTSACNRHLHFLVRHTTIVNKLFGCADCDYSSHHLPDLSLHMANHHLRVQSKCEMCSKKFSAERSLHQHRLTKHHGVQHECDVCGKRLSRRGKLSNHLHLHMI